MCIEGLWPTTRLQADSYQCLLIVYRHLPAIQKSPLPSSPRPFAFPLITRQNHLNPLSGNYISAPPPCQPKPLPSCNALSAKRYLLFVCKYKTHKAPLYDSKTRKISGKLNKPLQLVPPIPEQVVPLIPDYLVPPLPLLLFAKLKQNNYLWR